jgi:hypothetical protein
MGKIKERAICERQTLTFVTSDERAHFANTELNGLIRNFAVGDIRSVMIVTHWSDGEVGGSWHLEGDDAKAELLAHAEKMIAIIKNGALPPSTT